MASDPVTVISAGAKSILDLPKTLEVLETYGVPVLGYGTDMFPAFYTRNSGLPLEHSFSDVAGLADALALHSAVNDGTGALVVNPIPEDDALDSEEEHRLINAALADAEAQQVTMVLDMALFDHDIGNYHPLTNTATTAIAQTDLVAFLKGTGHDPQIVDVSENNPALEA
jgi:hypothetical protein